MGRDDTPPEPPQLGSGAHTCSKEPAILHEGLKTNRPGEKSPAAKQLADWFRQLDRFVRATRTYGVNAANVAPLRTRAVEELLQHISFHAPILLRCTALEIWLRDELVVDAPGPAEEGTRIDRRIPFLLYRDGIRAIQMEGATTREDIEAFLAALAASAGGRLENEDMVSLLWAVDLTGLSFEVAPLESALHVQTREEAAATETGPRLNGGGTEDANASNAIAGDAFNDWVAPGPPGDPQQLWQALAATESQATAAWHERWKTQTARPWNERAAELVRTARALESDPAMDEALCGVVVGWLGEAIEHGRWLEALQACESLPRSGEASRLKDEKLTLILAGLDSDTIAERLDESDADSQARFFALTVQLGRPALELMVAVMARATRPRLRAAATTALCYTCSGQPRLLAPYLSDSRWHVVRNIVFALGHIGGDEIADLLSIALRNPDSRVRRAVIHALGMVSPERRLPILITQLDTPDTQQLTAVIAMLMRSPGDAVAEALLSRINALDFEARPHEARLALLGALGETATDLVVPTLDAMLHKGGWFARRTSERTAAAFTLARIGSPAAMAVLESGARARAEAVRSASREALARNERAA